MDKNKSSNSIKDNFSLIIDTIVDEKSKKIDKKHWEYFYHQSQAMIVNDGLDPAMVSKFFALDERGKGGRV